jgi:hypothetical protein
MEDFLSAQPPPQIKPIGFRELETKTHTHTEVDVSLFPV